MIGIDPGLNVGSVTMLEAFLGGRKPIRSEVFKGNKTLPMLDRIQNITDIIIDILDEWSIPFKSYDTIAIEEPFYNRQFSNGKIYGTSCMLVSAITFLLKNRAYKVILVNNRTAKKIARLPRKHTKADVIQAYKERVGSLPPHKTKYGQETLADSYFIALAGLEALKHGKQNK